MEARADEPRFVSETFHRSDGLQRGLAVGLVVVTTFEIGDFAPLEFAAGEIAARAGVTQPGRAKHLRLIPRLANVNHPVRRLRLDESGVINLPVRNRRRTMQPEQLWQRHDVRQLLAKERAVAGDAVVLGSSAGEHRGAAGIAHRILHISPIEADAALSETVEIGRLRLPIAVATHRRSEIIRHDEEDVAARRRDRVLGDCVWSERHKKEQKEKYCHVVLSVMLYLMMMSRM